ncbi:MAG: hypothetical protein HMLKMBBP_02096 [Planctomycetes bacterium]|nr:hypothetical protein [Planctomycetota bacterium]
MPFRFRPAAVVACNVVTGTVVAGTVVMGTVVAADAVAAQPPVWKSTETVTSRLDCGGAEGCDARVASSWTLRVKLPLAGAADYDPSTVFTVAFDGGSWSAPLSSDPAYAPGRRSAELPLDASPGAPDGFTARLRWTSSRLTVEVRGARAVTLADFAEDPSAGAAAVGFATLGCVAFAGDETQFGLDVTGSRNGREVAAPGGGGGDKRAARPPFRGGGDEETIVLPSGTVRARGAAATGTAVPTLHSVAIVEGPPGKPTRSPFVDVEGSAADLGGVSRVSVQVGDGPEADAVLSAPRSLACGGSAATFRATVTLPSAGTHTITVRAQGAEGVAEARHVVRHKPAKEGPSVARMTRIGVRIPRSEAAGDSSVGLFTDDGRFFVQDIDVVTEDGDREARLRATARPGGIEGAADVRDWVLRDDNSPSKAHLLAVLLEDGTLLLDGEAQTGLPPIREIRTRAEPDLSQSFVLALGEDGTVHARGANETGMLGLGVPDEGDFGSYFRDSFAPVPGLSSIERIEISARTCFALSDAGTLWAWGGGAHHFRENPASDPGVPGVVPTSSPVADFAVRDAFGYDATDLLAAHDDGTVTARSAQPTMPYPGNGVRTRTGNGAYVPPFTVPGLSGITAIRTSRALFGGPNAFALRGSDGALFAWGANDYGQCGNGLRTEVLSPLQVDLGGAACVDARLFLDTSVARTVDGRAFAWGFSVESQATRAASEVQGLADVVEVLPIRTAVFARTGAGAVFMWNPHDAVWKPRRIELRN